MSNFAFLHPEWQTVHESARKAERLVYADSRASCFYARRALELAVSWLYKHDSGLRLPYQDHLSALIHEPTFRQTVGNAVFNKARVIKDLGNLAVHSQRPVRRGGFAGLEVLDMTRRSTSSSAAAGRSRRCTSCRRLS